MRRRRSNSVRVVSRMMAWIALRFSAALSWALAHAGVSGSVAPFEALSSVDEVLVRSAMSLCRS